MSSPLLLSWRDRHSHSSVGTWLVTHTRNNPTLVTSLCCDYRELRTLEVVVSNFWCTCAVKHHIEYTLPGREQDPTLHLVPNSNVWLSVLHCILRLHRCIFLYNQITILTFNEASPYSRGRTRMMTMALAFGPQLIICKDWTEWGTAAEYKKVSYIAEGDCDLCVMEECSVGKEMRHRNNRQTKMTLES